MLELFIVIMGGPVLSSRAFTTLHDPKAFQTNLMSDIYEKLQSYSFLKTLQAKYVNN